MPILPCGVFFESYPKDMGYLRTRGQWLCFIFFMVFLALLPTLFSDGFVAFVNVIGIMCIAVVGLQITIGYAGQMNLGQSAFMGMGAYTCAALANNFGLPFWITIPLGGLAGALFGALFGIPVLRIKGFYLALTTIAAQIMFPLIIMYLPESWFGSGVGLRVQPASFLGMSFDTETSLYYLIMTSVCIMVFFAFNLVRGRVGRALLAVRDNDIAAELTGINVFYYKTLAFFIGAMYGGVAGGLWAYYIRFVGVDQFTLFYSIWFVGMIIVGGQGKILGAILGVIFIRSMQEVITYIGPLISSIMPIQSSADIWFASMNVLLGCIIILFLIFEPRGIVHRWEVIKTSYRIWPFPYI